MSKFCVECGSGLDEDIRFCGECGHQVVVSDHQPEPTGTFTARSSENVAPAKSKSKKRWQSIAVGAGAAAVVTAVGVSALAVNSQGSEDVIKATEQPVPTASVQPPPPPPPVPNAPNSTGYWEGTMNGGDYGFYMSINEVDGEVSGWIEQWDTGDGDSGTEYFTGTRTGNTLNLRGTSWSPDTPDTWKLDTFQLKLNKNGQVISGTYDCDGCSSGLKPMSGSRTTANY